jgi:anti-sigma factor RsiW
MQVSRDVIRDLWALCEAGEASEDSRRLVDAFLAQDTELAATLRSDAGTLASPPPSLPVSHEAETLSRMKQRLNRRSPLRLLALALTGLAIARFIEQTTFVTLPVEVIGLSIAAVAGSIGYGWHTRYLQRRAVFTTSPGRSHLA